MGLNNFEKSFYLIKYVFDFFEHSINRISRVRDRVTLKINWKNYQTLDIFILMLLVLIKNLLHSSVSWFGLLIIFTVVALSCGTNFMSAMSAIHIGDMKCAGMFASEFFVSQKDLDSSLALAFLTSILFFLAVWIIVLMSQLISTRCIVHRLLKFRNILLRPQDCYLLKQFSQGILHPQIY